MKYKLDDAGFEIVPALLDPQELETLRKAFDAFQGARTELSDGMVAPGYRRVMERLPEVKALAHSPKMMGMLSQLLGLESKRGAYFPVRSLFLDKTDDANWLVPMHQDLSIAVDRQCDLPGFGPWSVKQGINYVTPPDEILRSMVTVRIHLDDCDVTNGALQVIPGSHEHGKLDSSLIADIKAKQKSVVCWCQSGDALVMRPLLLHASQLSQVHSHRRVIQIEFANISLPGGLRWAEAS